MSIKRILAATAVSLGCVGNASAISFGMDFSGYVTMLNGSDGTAFRNTSFATVAPYYGFRTPISGHMVMDIDANGLRGSATFDPFLFIGTLASGRNITFAPVATILNIPDNTLLLGNMSFDFGKFIKGIPVSIVLDMGNLTTALMQSSPGDVLHGVMRPASDDEVFTLPDGSQTKMPIGPVVVATTKWDTTDVDTDGDGQPGPLACGSNPSGTVPLLIDTTTNLTNGETGLGGSPIKACGFVGFSPNFDISEVTVTCVNAIGSCSTDGVAVPAVPLSPQPLGALLK